MNFNLKTQHAMLNLALSQNNMIQFLQGSIKNNIQVERSKKELIIAKQQYAETMTTICKSVTEAAGVHIEEPVNSQ